MLREQKVWFRATDGTPYERNVRETRWGNLSMEMGVARLYIHDEHISSSGDLKTVFRRPTEKIETHR
jgi:hypothetical protein